MDAIYEDTPQVHHQLTMLGWGGLRESAQRVLSPLQVPANVMLIKRTAYGRLSFLEGAAFHLWGGAHTEVYQGGLRKKLNPIGQP